MSGAPRVVRHPDARLFLARAEPWLLEAEEEHNLLLGLARSLLTSSDGFEEPIYLATVEAAGRLVGCAFRTPPFKLGITRMPVDAVPALVEDVARVYPRVPAVLGPHEVAVAFGQAWAARHGLEAVPGMRQRIHTLRRVTLPRPVAPGFMRPATPPDLPLVKRWLGGFLDETTVHGGEPDVLAGRLMKHGALVLWEDGEPVAMAASTGATPNTVRVGYVYTPEGRRGHGYATALVGHLSMDLLGRGYRSCVLYTDLANPTSNRIYRRLGYRPLQDVLDVEMRAPG